MTDDNEFEALLRELERTVGGDEASTPAVGERVRGTVVAIGSDYVFVDVGGKAEASIAVENLRGEDGSLPVSVGDELEAVVAGIDAETGALMLGGRHGKQVHGSAELEEAFRQGLPVEGTITGAIKGGVEVQVAGHRAFCPASQVDIRFIEDLSTLVGERYAFRITKYEGGRRLNLVLSRRALLEEEQASRAAEIREQLKEGAVLAGTVTGMKEFGAFVDLGGVEGMVHVSELALGRVRHPEEVLQVGQEVQVQVLRIEQTGNPKRPERIALSIRALAKDPWRDAASQYRPGTRVVGKVTRTQPFGAFVELEPGLEGLVHISELGAGRRVNHPDEVLRAGQQVEATVLQVDSERRRIGLTLADEGAAQIEAPVRAAPARTEAAEALDSGRGSLGDLLKAQLDKQRKP